MFLVPAKLNTVELLTETDAWDMNAYILTMENIIYKQVWELMGILCQLIQFQDPKPLNLLRGIKNEKRITNY